MTSKTTPTTSKTTTEYTQSQTQYRELDFSRLPNYECVCNTNNFIGRCTCFGIPKKKTETDEKPTKNTTTTKTTTATRMTQTKKQQKKTFCKFCYNRRRPASEYKSHFTKSGPEFGAKVVCPLLLQQQCARCGEIGHTPTMCKSEHYIRSDSNFPENPCSMDFNLSILQHPVMWQHPIPPALQARHATWVDENVKTSRVMIMMSGDHSHYTNDFYLSYGGPNWVSFSQKPKTEYEQRVTLHYSWMRRNFQSEAEIEMMVTRFAAGAGAGAGGDFISNESERERLNTTGDEGWSDISRYNAAARTNEVATVVRQSMAVGGGGGSALRLEITPEEIREIIRKYVVVDDGDASQ